MVEEIDDAVMKEVVEVVEEVEMREVEVVVVVVMMEAAKWAEAELQEEIQVAMVESTPGKAATQQIC